MELTQSIIKELLNYDPETGIFTWKLRDRKHFPSNSSHAMWNSRFAGQKANSESFDGRIRISIFKERYYAHRIAWLYTYGEWPAHEIDHINGETTDNRIINLRDVPHATNQKNQKTPKNSASGIAGVCWGKSKRKWRAYIVLNDTQKYLGDFHDFFEACCARKSAENKYGFHPNHGRV